MLAYRKQIDKRTTMKNQNRNASLGRPAMKLLRASTSLRSTNPRPEFCLDSSDTVLFGLLGRFGLRGGLNF